jgi:hypothetical protein
VCLTRAAGTHVADSVCCLRRFYLGNGALSFTNAPVHTALAFAAAALYACSLSASRLFLGVHSIGDVTAGVVRGTPAPVNALCVRGSRRRAVVLCCLS